MAARNDRIAERLSEIADLLDVTGANHFRVRAYRNAARTVENHPDSLAELIEAGGDPTDLPGIGKDIGQLIREFVESGSMSTLRELRAEVPEGLPEVMNVRGVGPKKAAKLYEALGIDGLDALETAAREGRVAELDGFGEKTQSNILEGIERARRFGERTRRADAERAVEPLLDYLRGSEAVDRLELAGSFRRGRDTVGDLDVLITTDDPEGVMARFTEFPEVDDVLWSGSSKTTVVLEGGLQVDVRAVPAEAFGAAWLYFTGSKEHNVRLRGRANDAGRSLNEYGLFEGEEGEGERVASETEADIYHALGLAWIPPELREDDGEIDVADPDRDGDLPELIDLGDIRADLHLHSDWSDGRSTLREMITACAERGYAAMAITDHSPALAMTGGLGPDKLRRQWDALDELIEEDFGGDPGIRVLRGMEVDILEDGALDMTDELLARMDLVVASLHTPLGLDEAEQTERVLRALEHPAVNILGHLTGRLVNQRDPYPMDVDAIFAAAAERGVALEINAAPARLDLHARHARRAVAAGCRIAIDTDAHHVGELEQMRFGVTVARRAWLRADQVINTWSLDDLEAFLAKR